MQNSLMNIPFLELDANALTQQDKLLLGPLADFVGTWSNKGKDGTLNPLGWNFISIPGAQIANPAILGVTTGGFILETIPYYETIEFTPIAITANFGSFSDASDANSEQIQQIGALLYKQNVYSAGLHDIDPNFPHTKDLAAYFKKKNFDFGDAIHAEVGMLLNISNYNDDGSTQIARMGSIPHGNSILCLGNSASGTGAPQIESEVKKEKLLPFPEDPSQSLLPDYLVGTYQFNPSGPPQYPFKDINPTEPWTPLTSNITPSNIDSHTHLSLSTTTGTGGLLSIPFVGNTAKTGNVTLDTTQMDVDYWLSKDTSGGLTLQYFQNIRIVFPSTGSGASEPLRIVWPHIGLNTLTKEA